MWGEKNVSSALRVSLWYEACRWPGFDVDADAITVLQTVPGTTPAAPLRAPRSLPTVQRWGWCGGNAAAAGALCTDGPIADTMLLSARLKQLRRWAICCSSATKCILASDVLTWRSRSTDGVHELGPCRADRWFVSQVDPSVPKLYFWKF